MSVLILEDILAIVMMVMLSAIAGGSAGGGEMLNSVLRIGFFLVLWFVVGIFLIPLILRSLRKFINGETLLIVSLGLCCLMAVISTKVGFSSAFGAFVMGSILAETVEAEKIIRLVAPVKNLFGAIFFVSVGMLVDPGCSWSMPCPFWPWCSPSSSGRPCWAPWVSSSAASRSSRPCAADSPWRR